MKLTFSVLFASAMTLICFNAQAQTKKGQIMVGANLSYSKTNTDYTAMGVDAEYKLQQVILSPRAGIGVGSNWIIGVMGGYGLEKQTATGTSGSDFKSKSYSAGAFIRKFHPLVEKFGIYGQANFEYAWGTSVQSDWNNMKVKILQAYCEPGFYFAPGKRIVLETTFGRIGYINRKTKMQSPAPPSDRDEKKFDFSITDGLSIGINFIL